ncbi:MAG: RluA family pseudouridine synthase [Tistlia sp.]|uniref:RluA family pseudouridine synthase n=1 Tax=Tistlia sp. TaxID=3057121 RepID=UPI0034A2BA51
MPPSAGAAIGDSAPADAAPLTGPHSFEIAAPEAGERVDRLIARRLPSLSRSRVKGLIEAGALSAAGATIDEPSTRVKAGQRYLLTVPEATAALPEAQARELAILYEDEALLVLDKPAGLVVHPAPGNPDQTLVNALLAHCGDSFAGIGGVRRPGIVHRLDKDTSGLMVVAKTDAAHRSLTVQFAERSIERRYRALVWGRLLPPAPATKAPAARGEARGEAWGEITGNIGRSPRNRKKMAVLQSGGKAAVTRYKLERLLMGGAVSMITCRLLTGRTHQIRVHLASRGHPLLGDPLYGRSKPAALAGLPGAARTKVEGFARQALHAERLGFDHPLDGRKLAFESPPPPDMAQLIESLDSL